MAAQRKKPGARRGWQAMTVEERKAWKIRKDEEAKLLTRTVAEAILDLIDRGETTRDEPALVSGTDAVPGSFRPRNIIYGNFYQGVNALALAAQARKRGQPDCRFLTKRSVARLKDKDGQKARLKEDAVPYVVISPHKGQDRELARDEELSRYPKDRLDYRPDGTVWLRGQIYFSAVHVYSIADTTAVAPPLVPEPGAALVEHSFLEHFVAACGAKVVYDSKSAYYFKPEDVIHMPPKECFASQALYYGTLAHEFYHWSGGNGREDRGLGTCFGDEKYILEEMQAELFAAVTSVMFGFGHSLRNCAGYIRDWNIGLEDRPGDILFAARQVQRMVCAIHDVADGKKPDIPWLQDRDFSSVPTPLKEARARGLALEQQWRREMGLEEVAREEADCHADSHTDSQAIRDCPAGEERPTVPSAETARAAGDRTVVLAQPQPSEPSAAPDQQNRQIREERNPAPGDTVLATRTPASVAGWPGSVPRRPGSLWSVLEPERPEAKPVREQAAPGGRMGQAGNRPNTLLAWARAAQTGEDELPGEAAGPCPR